MKMPTLRKRKTQTLETNTDPNPETNNDQSPKISLYEQSREERIKENLERMQKLGLKDLSLKLKSSLVPPKRTPRNNPSSTKQPSPLLSSGPTRRSSRLQNVTPVSYSEVVLAKKGGPLEDEDVKLEEGSKPEVYTEEHEKLLGNTERSWTLFVDGYGKDRKRIYDQVNGKTCHQCRQKTLGYHTQCTICKIVQGQFCGDCLYMRYGEHVLEAMENPNWICPVCRGICNCSLCRHAKGWAPTGTLYRKISSLGYKSVAHYLIQTRRVQNNEGKNSVTGNQVSAKRPLLFSDMEALSKESPEVSDKQDGSLKCQSMNKIHDEFQSEKIKEMPSSGNSTTDGKTKRSLPFSSCEAQSENMESADFNHEVHDDLGKSKPKFEDMIENVLKGVEQKELLSTDKEHDDNNNALQSCPELKKKHGLAFKPSPDSIAARLRQRCSKGNGHDEERHVEDDKLADSTVALESSARLEKKLACATEPSPDSIGGRLRQRRRMGKGDGDVDLLGTNEQISDVQQVFNILPGKEVEVNIKLTSTTKPSEDSIAKRLRPRHKTA